MAAWRISARGIDAGASNVVKSSASLGPHALSLARSKDRKLDSVFGEHFQCFRIDGSFGQPHPFGSRPNRLSKSLYPPLYLRDLISPVRKREESCGCSPERWPIRGRNIVLGFLDPPQ